MRGKKEERAKMFESKADILRVEADRLASEPKRKEKASMLRAEAVEYASKANSLRATETYNDLDSALLEIKNVTKVFAPGTVNEKVALENINLTVNKGDVICVIGSNGSGKSTLFNAITNSHVLAENYPFATIDPNSGVVVVPDERLDYIFSKYNTKKKVNATFEFYDIAGLVKGASKGEGLGNQFLAAIRECDAIVEVVRCFENANVVRYNDDPVNPKNDIDVINLELSMSDLESVNNRIGKQESNRRCSGRENDRRHRRQIRY